MFLFDSEVTCHVLGWAKVDWTPSGRMSDSGSDHYRAEEGYINKIFNLYGSGDYMIIFVMVTMWNSGVDLFSYIKYIGYILKTSVDSQ